MLVYIVCLVPLLHNADSLLCFNGTFSYKQFGEDPLLYRGVFSPSKRTIAKLRCALTVMCPVCMLLLSWSSGSSGLLCYNCSSMHQDWSWCSGDFASSHSKVFNSSADLLVNCTGDNAMCFVRSWSARAQHSWLVQRGCYQPVADDPLPRALTTPTRAMTCKHQKFPEADYKVCLCQADWCNTSTQLTPVYQPLVNNIRRIFYTSYKFIYFVIHKSLRYFIEKCFVTECDNLLSSALHQR